MNEEMMMFGENCDEYDNDDECGFERAVCSQEVTVPGFNNTFLDTETDMVPHESACSHSRIVNSINSQSIANDNFVSFKPTRRKKKSLKTEVD